jgi:cell division protein FtsW
LLILVLALTFIGIPFVYDTSFPHGLSPGQNPYRFVEMQLLWGILGVIGMACTMVFPYWKLQQYAKIFASVCGIALLMVLIPHVGMRENGAARWIGHGALRLQPSEFAKAALILFVAGQCCVRPSRRNDWTRWTSPAVIAVVLFSGAIAIEPDLGTAVVVLGTGFGVLYFAGMQKRRLLAILLAMVVFGGGLMEAKSFLHRHTDTALPAPATTDQSSGSFQLDRLTVWTHPDQYCDTIGYQVCHSRLAFGTGGLLGAGFGAGQEKFFLPEADSDFIFSTVGEELGLAGSLGMLILFGYLVFRGVSIAVATRDSYGSLLAAGISIMIGLQSAINIATVTSVIPATGVPLPFISYGGSSLCVCLTLAGVLLNISRHPYGDPERRAKSSEAGFEQDFNRRWDRQRKGSETDSWGYPQYGLTAAMKVRNQRRAIHQ